MGMVFLSPAGKCFRSDLGLKAASMFTSCLCWVSPSGAALPCVIKRVCSRHICVRNLAPRMSSMDTNCPFFFKFFLFSIRGKIYSNQYLRVKANGEQGRADRNKVQSMGFPASWREKLVPWKGLKLSISLERNKKKIMIDWKILI